MLEIPFISDDGLATPEIGAWGIYKYRLASLYSSMFARSMRRKWDYIVYLDLFAGAGHSRIRKTNNIVPAVPMLVLGSEAKFDKYIFCEENAENVSALEERIARSHAGENTVVLNSDTNKVVDRLLAEIPSGSRTNKVLSFCFVDPFKCSNLHFTTIETLSKKFMDFLILLPSGMDANRNFALYLSENETVLDNFFGNTDWRDRWLSPDNPRTRFEHFFIDEFGRSMNNLGYIDPGAENAAPVRSDEKNLLLYRLALYSKHPLATKFWKEAQKYSNEQMSFDI